MSFAGIRDRIRTGQYVDQGSGDAIVLLHGDGGTLNTWIDSGVLPNLAQDYRVIAFDTRGSGKSGKPRDVKAYGREQGLDVIRLLDHLGIRRAHIIGYSMGAHTTAQLLTTHAERFISATLGGAAGRFRWTDEQAAGAEQEASESERECVSRSQIYRLAPTNAPSRTRRRSSGCQRRVWLTPTKIDLHGRHGRAHERITSSRHTGRKRESADSRYRR
jgi:pimeloyl-ACP methyl ester carboxylesterase